ncbi:MAG: hypothetical protein HYY21_01685 [Candidatus Tectomicrobia bacterium]|nr:hypothetical protein [Candidatus Tectomicrobia bacterium]
MTPASPDPSAARARTPPLSLIALGLIVLALFGGAGSRWAAEIQDRLKAQRAIGLVQGRQVTNLTEDAVNTDGRSYDWIARREAPGTYQVKQNIVLDRIWRFDRWENLCWQVRLRPEEVRPVRCAAIGWDRTPRDQGR